MSPKLRDKYDEANTVLKDALQASRSEITGLGLDPAGKYKPLPPEPAADAWFELNHTHGVLPPAPPPGTAVPKPVADVRELKQEHALTIVMRCEATLVAERYKADLASYPKDKAHAEAEGMKPPSEPRKGEPRLLSAIPCSLLQGFCQYVTYELTKFLQELLKSVYIIKPVHVTATPKVKGPSRTEHYFTVAAPRWSNQGAPASEAIIIDLTWAQFATRYAGTPLPDFYPLVLVGTVDELRRSNEMRRLLKQEELQALLARYEAGAYAVAKPEYNLW